MTPEQSEALIEAVARGDVPVGDDGFAAALTAAHIRPADPKTPAPDLAGAPGMGAVGFVRRTAVGASFGLLALAGVATAGTAGVVLLSSNAGDAEVTVSDELPPATTLVTTTTEASQPADDEAEGDGGESDSDVDRERGDEIDGVDPSDGLDDAELELLCDAAVNHGEYVSAVARDTEGLEDGERRGDRVRAAAASACGKDGDAADEDTDDSESTDDAEGSEDDGLDRRPDHSDGPGNGSGKAKGHEKNGKSARETTETDDGEADVEP